MADINNMKFNAVVYEEDGGYVAQCINVDVASEGESEDEALANLREALKLYFDDEPALTVPKVAHVKVTQLTVAGA